MPGPTPNRRIEKLTVSRNGRMVVIDTVANAFLMHMVRNIAGTLKQVGLGVLGIGEVSTLLALETGV
ncbi:MAG: hypothetical protein CM1200mP9_03200 [Gammaproteobacteria bacterium]|nr:MAG: hypothetical protein CM1200mP9_03200 [Gammaproteobacteria bacterium]